MYVQSDTLLLVDVSENFRNTCLEIYELDPPRFLTTPSLAWQAALKNQSKVRLDLLTNIDTLLMSVKGISGGICHDIHQYAKANKKYMKGYDKTEEPLYLKYWDVNK